MRKQPAQIVTNKRSPVVHVSTEVPRRLGQSRVIQTIKARSLPRSRRRCCDHVGELLGGLFLLPHGVDPPVQSEDDSMTVYVDDKPVG